MEGFGYTETMARPRKLETELLVNLGVKVPPRIEQRIAQIGRRHDRPKGNVARLLLLMGLAEYERDGRLDDVVLLAAERDENNEDAAPDPQPDAMPPFPTQPPLVSDVHMSNPKGEPTTGRLSREAKSDILRAKEATREKRRREREQKGG